LESERLGDQSHEKEGHEYDSNANNDGVSRREFIGVKLSQVVPRSFRRTEFSRSKIDIRGNGGWIEATIPDLQALMNSGALTSVQLYDQLI